MVKISWRASFMLAEKNIVQYTVFLDLEGIGYLVLQQCFIFVLNHLPEIKVEMIQLLARFGLKEVAEKASGNGIFRYIYRLIFLARF